jgi:hypothetical protein
MYVYNLYETFFNTYKFREENKMAKTAKKKASAPAEMNEAAPAAAPAVEAPEAAPADDGSQITIADLQAMASVIDAAVRRGAFGASEVADVGAVYTKLTNFLKVVAEQQKAQADQ